MLHHKLIRSGFWLIAIGYIFINYKEHGFRSQSFKPFEIFLRNTVHDCNQLPIQRIKFQKIYVKLYASCAYIYHGATTFQVAGMIPPRTFQKVVLKVENKNLRPDLLRPHKEVWKQKLKLIFFLLPGSDWESLKYKKLNLSRTNLTFSVELKKIVNYVLKTGFSEVIMFLVEVTFNKGNI